MNRFVTAVTSLDVDTVRELLKQPKWLSWAEPSGKNALHYLCGLNLGDDRAKNEAALSILKTLLKSGMNIESPHRIDEKNCDAFPATPLWYAYNRGRNQKLYKYLLKQGADPDHCWWAIAWYDDVKAADLWLKHGAKLGVDPGLNDLFLGTFAWKKYTFVRWLLEKGADANARGPGGLTALMFAVKRKDEEAVKMLLKYGADPDRASDKRISARKLAEEKGPRRIASLF